MSIDLKKNENFKKGTKFPIEGSKVIFKAEKTKDKKRLIIGFNCPSNNKLQLVRKNQPNQADEYQFEVRKCKKECKEEMIVDIREGIPENIRIWTRLPKDKPDDSSPDTDRGTVVQVQPSGRC